MSYQIVEAAGDRNNHFYPEYTAQDEIDLVDLLRTLLKHKRLILSLLAISMLTGLVLMLIAPSKYQTSTRLEIGAYHNISDHEKPNLIESPAAVVAKLKSGYIPKEIYRYEQANEVKLSDKVINVSTPKNSNIIVLQSAGPQRDSEKLSQLQTRSAEALLIDHKQRIHTLEEELRFKLSKAELKLDELENKELFQLLLENEQNKIKLAKNELMDLQDNIKTIQSQIEELKFEEQLIKEQENILTGQLSEVSKLLTSMDMQREDAVKVADNSNSVMTLMLLDNERRQLFDRQAEITNMLNIDLKEKAQDLVTKTQQTGFELDRALRNETYQKAKIAQLEGEIIKLKYDRNLEIQNQKQNIEALKARLSGIIPTSVIVGPVQSSTEQSRRSLYLPVAIILGAILALMLVAMIELMKKVKGGEQTIDKNQLTSVSET